MTEGECAIPMCGVEDSDGDVLVPCCENGHRLHSGCMERLAATGAILCPMCRSSVIENMISSVVVPAQRLFRTPYSLFGARIAIDIGKIQRVRS